VSVVGHNCSIMNNGEGAPCFSQSDFRPLVRSRASNGSARFNQSDLCPPRIFSTHLNRVIHGKALDETAPNMKRASLLFLTLFAGSSLLAQIPETLSYQSYMTDTDGVPVDTTVSMTFALFDVEEGGEALWTETQEDVVVSGGVLSTTLGQVESLFSLVFDRPLWLEATFNVPGKRAVDGPRMPLDAVPYSMGTRGFRYDRASLNIVAGYEGNSIETGASKATIGGGGTLDGENTIDAGGSGGTIAGGYGHNVEGENGTISGGFANRADAIGASVPGGQGNQAFGEYSFAAGFRARAGTGSFVWSGYESDDDEQFTTSTSQQFLIRARNGVGIGTNSPKGALHVNAVSNAIPDIVLGGTDGVDADGILSSDPDFGDSNILLTSNGNVAVQLDADDNTSNTAFTVADATGTVIFQVLEAGAVLVKAVASESEVRAPSVRLNKSLGEGGKGIPGEIYQDNVVYAWAAVEFNGAASASYSCTTERVDDGVYVITPFTALGEGISAVVTPRTDKNPVFASVEVIEGAVRVSTFELVSSQNGLDVVPSSAAFYIQVLGRP
jgi:hypothetical protein